MKKILAAFIAICLMVMLCSCGKMVECDFCDEEIKKSEAHKGKMFDETAYLCDKCYEWLELNEDK